MPWRGHRVLGDDVFDETGALAWGLEGALEGVEDGAEGREGWVGAPTDLHVGIEIPGEKPLPHLKLGERSLLV